MELEVSSLVASEGLTDPTAVAARFKELGHPEYGDRYIKTIADRVASLRTLEKGRRDAWLAESAALSQILGPYVNKKEWKDVTEKRAAFQEVLKNGARFGLGVSQLGSEPTVFVDDLLMVTYQRGLSVEQQVKLFGGPSLKERLEEEGAAMDHISRVFGSLKNNQRWQRELLHSERILPPEYFARIPEFYSPEAVATVKSFGKQPTTGIGRTIDLPGPDGKLHTFQFNPQTQEYDKDLGLSARGGSPDMVNLRQIEADLRKRAIVLEEKKFERGGESPADARRAMGIILSYARLLIEGDPRKYRKNTEAATADARAWYAEVAEEFGRGDVGTRQRRVMPDGTEWEETTPGRWKRVK